MTISENVRYGLTALSRQEAEKEAAIALSRVGLEGYANIYPHALSGGEQQRVALARALAPRPAVLLMDEPFSGLDSRLKDSVRAETLALLRQSRATAIVVTHDAEEAMRMGDRIALLNKGRLVQVGTAEELYEKPADLFVAGFFSELNIFDTKIAINCVDTPVGRFPAPQFDEGTTVSVAIRLAGFKVSETDSGIPARIVSRRYLGLTEILDLAVPGAQSLVRARIRRGNLTTGQREISLYVDKSDVMVFERRAERA
jgi:iron(III) transport system ATP-binding protein